LKTPVAWTGPSPGDSDPFSFFTGAISSGAYHPGPRRDRASKPVRRNLGREGCGTRSFSCKIESTKETVFEAMNISPEGVDGNLRLLVLFPQWLPTDPPHSAVVENVSHLFILFFSVGVEIFPRTRDLVVHSEILKALVLTPGED
jgi:hypothetical protein